MRNTLNLYQDSIKSYYNIIKAYSELLDEVEHNKCGSTLPFLDYCYDIATLEFEDGPEYHAAIEYKSHEAQAIIAAAERFEEIVDEYYEDDDEWNALFELYYHSKEIPL